MRLKKKLNESLLKLDLTTIDIQFHFLSYVLFFLTFINYLS